MNSNHIFTFTTTPMLLVIIIVATIIVTLIGYHLLKNMRFILTHWQTVTFFRIANFDGDSSLEGWVDEDGTVITSWLTGPLDDKPPYASHIPNNFKMRVLMHGSFFNDKIKPMFDETALHDEAQRNMVTAAVTTAAPPN